MIIYVAGFRSADYKYLKKLPRKVLFTFDDVGPYGGGEQKKLFRELLAQRKAAKK